MIARAPVAELAQLVGPSATTVIIRNQREASLMVQRPWRRPEPTVGRSGCRSTVSTISARWRCAPQERSSRSQADARAAPSRRFERDRLVGEEKRGGRSPLSTHTPSGTMGDRPCSGQRRHPASIKYVFSLKGVFWNIRW